MRVESDAAELWFRNPNVDVLRLRMTTPVSVTWNVDRNLGAP